VLQYGRVVGATLIGDTDLEVWVILLSLRKFLMRTIAIGDGWIPIGNI
jgi:hypothetical protein